MSFSGDIRRFKKKAMEEGSKKSRMIMIDLFQGVIMTNPVAREDGGFSRANWIASMDAMPSGTVDNKDPSGSSTISKARDVINDYELKDATPVFFSNSAPYIFRLEYDSWSGQAPNGMVRVNIERVKAKYR